MGVVPLDSSVSGGDNAFTIADGTLAVLSGFVAVVDPDEKGWKIDTDFAELSSAEDFAAGDDANEKPTLVDGFPNGLGMVLDEPTATAVDEAFPPNKLVEGAEVEPKGLADDVMVETPPNRLEVFLFDEEALPNRDVEPVVGV
jgi:hypothetical protein